MTTENPAQLVRNLPWTPWPSLPVPTERECDAVAQTGGPERLFELWEQREGLIQAEQRDPLNHGWESPPAKIARALLAGTYRPGVVGTPVADPGWAMAAPANDLLFGGGNGSGKSFVCAKLVMEVLLRGKDREARCYSQNEESSIRYVQRPMFRFLPPALRAVKSQGQVTKISYKEATGFSEMKFVLPTHSTALFKTYKSWQQDPNSVEGGEAHVVWCDEEVPAELLDTLRFRAFKARGFVLVSFTPVSGYTEAIAQYLEGATVLESIPARRVIWEGITGEMKWSDELLPPGMGRDRLFRGCPPGHVPLVMQSGEATGRRFVVLCPTMFNPYLGGLDETILLGLSKNLEYALERLWGLPTKRSQPAFPRFGDVHIVPPERVPPLSEMTCYQFTDPHGARNWFTQWWGRDAEGNRWLYREWPDATCGEWTLPGGDAHPGGKEGEAQRYEAGKSFDDYKRLFLRCEGWDLCDDGSMKRMGRVDSIFDRRMDPRPAGTIVPSQTDAETYLDYMGKPVMRADGTVAVPGLEFLAAEACGIEEGFQFISNALAEGWKEDQPITPLNCPKTYISSACQNTIYALRTCPKILKEKDPVKDPIDCFKMAMKHGIPYVEPGAMMSLGGGSY